MKNRKVAFLLIGSFLVLAMFLRGCVINSGEDVTDDTETSAVKEKQKENPEEKDIQDTYRTVKCVSLCDLYDYEDDLSLQNGVYSVITDSESEEAFWAYFYTESDSFDVIEEADAKILKGSSDGKNVFVAFLGENDAGYPKYAYGFKYSPDDAIVEAKYDSSKKGDEIFDEVYSLNGEKYDLFDLVKPLLDYQEKTYVKDNNKIVKVEYSADPKEHGTYNSSGTVYYDEQERPFYKSYYSTSGTRYTIYLYNTEGDLNQIFDFGGLPYKELEGNPSLDIGIDVTIYFF